MSVAIELLNIIFVILVSKCRVKVKFLCSCLTKYHAVKMYKGVEVELHPSAALSVGKERQLSTVWQTV
jgi:hypothetical protein